MSDVRMYDFNGVITECFGPKPILPFKIFWNDVVFVDEIRGAAFNLLYNFSQRNIWIQQKQSMHMVLHAIDCSNGASHLFELLFHVIVDHFFFFKVNQEITVFG